MWNKLRNLKELDKDDVLELLGLETRRTTADYLLPAVGFFGLGLIVGAGLGLMLAPKSGAQLREDIRQRLTGGPDQMAGQFPQAAQAPERPRTM